MRLGSGLGLSKPSGTALTYIKDGLKLYMPYKGADTTKGTQFVGTGSTSFDGSNDYVDCGDDTSLDITSAITLLCWIKPMEIDVNNFIAGRDDGTNRNYFLEVGSDEKFYWTCKGVTDTEVTSTTIFSSGTWYHIAGVYDGVNMILYVNGVAEDTDASTGSIDNDDVSFTIGAREAGMDRHFKGNIKNVAIWSRALTATEVQNVMYKSYVNVSGRLASGLVSWWALEGEVGSDGNAGSGYILDEVAGAGSTTNLGTISGATVDTDLYGGDTPVIPRGIDNAPTVQADAIGAGSALLVASNTDYINFGDACDLGSTADFTITAWVKSTEWTEKYYLSKWESGNARWKLGGSAADKLQFHSLYGSASEGIAYTGSTTLYEDDWIHLAIVADRSANIKGYINGVLDDTDTEAGALDFDANIDNSGNLSIGFEDEANIYFDGNICQVGIWSAVLTQAQIQSIMEKTYEELIASERTNLVSYWALDEAVQASGDAASWVPDKVGGIYGDEIIPDGTFDASDTYPPSGFSHSGSTSGSKYIEFNSNGARLVFDGDGTTGTQMYVNPAPMTVGATYHLTFDCTVDGGGDAKFDGGGTGDSGSIGSTGAKEDIFVAGQTTLGFMRLNSGSSCDITINNISLKQILGNPGKLT
jgi:hypothetical protein